jgi:transposase
MKEKVRFLGLDVHAETIAVALAEPEGEVRSLGTIPNRAESIRKLVKKLGPAEKLRACYEAGPTGYVVYWQLAELGVHCDVVAPTLVAVKAGDRVKTDRRDAEKLARCYRSGDLTAVWVPDDGSEALRDLVRAREAAKQDQMRARHRLSKFLLRSGQRPPTGVRPWTRPYLIWVAQLRFTQIAQESTRQDYLHEVEHMRERVTRLEQAITEAVKLASPALQQIINDRQALRGIADISAVTIAAELGQVSRFGSARQLMGYCGAVPSEDSSGKRTRRGGITKNRQRALATNRCRSSMELSSSSMHPVRTAQATGEHLGRGERDCVEGATPAAQAVYETGRSGQRPEEDCHSISPRPAGLHLGHRNQSRDYFQAASCSLTTTKAKIETS